MNVGQLMKRSVMACQSDGTLNAAAQIISLNDIAAEAGHEAGARKRDISLAEVGQTLAAVCKPRASGLIASAA